MHKAKTGMSGHTNKGAIGAKHPLGKQAVKANKPAGPTKAKSAVHKKTVSQKAKM